MRADPGEQAGHLHSGHLAEVAAYYESVTDLYRTVWGNSYHFARFKVGESRAEALASTELMVAADGGYQPGQNVLDVGCGIGGPALTISRQTGARVVGVDLLRRHVETAQARAEAAGLDGRVSFVQADAQRLPFRDGSFDHVYLFESACHLPDKARFYQECARVLRSGGSFGGTDWMRRDGPLDDHERASLLRVCAGFRCPELLSLTELRARLASADLVPALIEDLAASGDLTPNWEPMASSLRDLNRPGSAEPRAAAILSRAGAELVAAAARGTFVVGRWLAWKP